MGQPRGMPLVMCPHAGPQGRTGSPPTPEPHTTRGAPWPQPRDAPCSVDDQLACSSSLSIAASAGWIRWGGYGVAVAVAPGAGLAAVRT
ncbi:hypothetical protein BAURA63_02441 [Brevibacterium aurantiacum]|uniref:Uncharacterized protein n=1 Tax=Brevibacterium aurantiacum TaxID=273384 RepID=A0A2H1JP00_BREAU|nr:hypothetical protein BAURA63_02441 [Brevibacterium aurantiacum]